MRTPSLLPLVAACGLMLTGCDAKFPDFNLFGSDDTTRAGTAAPPDGQTADPDGIIYRTREGRQLSREEENRLLGARMHNQVGLDAFSKEDYEAAIQRFGQALSLVPDYVAALNNLGRAYYAVGKFGAALGSYERALALARSMPGRNDRELASIHANIGDVHRQRQEYTDAVTEYLEVLHLAPNMPRAHYELGNLYLKQGRNKDAIYRFTKTLELDARFDKALVGRAIAYNLQGQYAKAWADIVTLEDRGFDVHPELREQVMKGLEHERTKGDYRPGI